MKKKCYLLNTVCVLVLLLGMCFLVFTNMIIKANAWFVDYSVEYTTHCFADSNKYGGDQYTSDLEYSKAVKFSAEGTKSQDYAGMPTYPGKVDFKVTTKITSKKISGDHDLQSDILKELNLSYLGEGSEVTISSIENNGLEKVGYGLLLYKEYLDDGTTKVRVLKSDFFKESIDSKQNKDYVFPFTKNGKYTVSLFFEADGTGKNNHRVDYSFRIINVNDDNNNKNAIVIDNKAGDSNYSGHVPKNGVTFYGGRINYNNLKHISSTYSFTNVNGNKEEYTAYNEMIFTAEGRYEFSVKIGPFDLESFYVIVDRGTPIGSLSNGKLNDKDGYLVAEGFSEIVWNVGGVVKAEKKCRVFNASEYTDNGSNFIAESSSGSLKVEREGSFIIEIRFCGNLAAAEYPVLKLLLKVEPYVAPTFNKDALSANRFNNVKTKWYDVKSGNDLNSFYDKDRAIAYAMALEDSVVSNQANFYSKYYYKYSVIQTMYNKYSGAHSAKIAGIRRNNLDNMELTAIMSAEANKNVKAVYFDLEDRTERNFEESSMFDNNKLWLDDEFQFVQQADWESKTITYKNQNTNVTGNINYGIPIKNQNIPNGAYTITEKDKYGQTTIYTAYRDKTAPEVMININGGDDSYAIGNKTYFADFLEIKSFSDVFDSWAVLKINDEYYINNELPSIFYKSGKYSVDVYDRNGNKLNFTFVIAARAISAEIESNNYSKKYTVENGGVYSVYNFSLALNSSNFIDTFYEIKVNNAIKSYKQILEEVNRKAGIYNYVITDKYNGNFVGFTVNILQRELSSFIIVDDDELLKSENLKTYYVNRFKLAYDDTFIEISCNKIINFNEYVFQQGEYDFIARDVYNNESLRFKIVVENKDISVPVNIDDGSNIVLGGGESLVVKQFKINKISNDVLYYMDIFINGTAYNNNSDLFTKPGIYNIYVENRYNQNRYQSIFVIEERPVEIGLLINNTEDYKFTEQVLHIKNFIISDIPDYLDVFLNGKRIRRQSDDILYSNPDFYEIILIDRYSGEQASYCFVIEARDMRLNVVYDGNIENKILTGEINARRFKIVDIEDYLDVTINGNKYLESNFITQEGIYEVKITDKYSFLTSSFNIIIDGETANVTLIYDDNKKIEIDGGETLFVYRFRFNPLLSDIAQYTNIKINGSLYDTFNSYILDANTYNISVTDIYKGTEITAVIVILERDFTLLLTSNNEPISYLNGQIYNLASFSLLNKDSFATVLVNDKQIENNSTVEYYAFGQYSISLIDVFNDNRISFTINIYERDYKPEVCINNELPLDVAENCMYSVYRFKLKAKDNQQILVNGSAHFEDYILEPSIYFITVKDIYNQKVFVFGITVKEMSNELNILVDDMQRLNAENESTYNVKRFNLDYKNVLQADFLAVSVNDEKHEPNEGFFTEFGEYRIVISNIYSGEIICLNFKIIERSLVLPIVYDNDMQNNITTNQSVLRFRLGDLTALKEFADIDCGSISEFGDYITEFGKYDFMLRDKYNDTVIKITVTELL